MNAAWAFSTFLILTLAFGGNPSTPVPHPPGDITASADITLKTRATSSFQTASGAQSRVRTEAIYISSGRERRDFSWEASAQAPSMTSTSIRDCSQHRWIMLAHEPRTYNIQPFPDIAAQQATAERIAKAKADIQAGRLKPTPIPPDTPVTTIETIDTGERREVAGLTLRHLRQTERTSGNAGEVRYPKRSEMREGWYVNLPEVTGCGESTTTSAQTAVFSTLRVGVHTRDGIDLAPRLEFKGASPVLGTPVEETRISDLGDGTTVVDKTELVQLSRAPIDPKLFDIPSGYREALHTPGGGRDMMQPDTLFNRARAWWQQVWPRWTFWSARIDR